ncbi:hypothetical protein SARC_14527, partial [Sphaeroforma arctica JP610]
KRGLVAAAFGDQGSDTVRKASSRLTLEDLRFLFMGTRDEYFDTHLDAL